MKYHMTAFLLGFLLDLLLGDPYWLPHPVRLIGKGITKTEALLRPAGKMRTNRQELQGGRRLVVIVLLATTLFVALLLLGAYALHPFLGLLAETIMTYQILAVKCLKVESMKVYHCLKEQGLVAARGAVSMIVGRDTAQLDAEGVTKAAVETVAENTSDGIIAPMLYTAIGGPVLGFFYKAVNTMDSMIGYKNERYLYFGRGGGQTG